MSWTVLSSRENDKVWTKVNRVVKWKPGLQCSRMKPPTPYIVYDVSAGFKEDGRFRSFQMGITISFSSGILNGACLATLGGKR